jgi:uncharacterized protein (TIGR03437 family)
VTADGRITTICGNGRFNAIGDDGWALQSGTGFPSMTAVRPDGKLYLADTQNNKIRVLTPVAQQGANALPVVDADGVAAAIDFGGQRRLAPGTWVEIRGTGLAGAARSWTVADFDGMSAPTELEGTRVTVGGLPAYVSFVSPGQVNAQLPLGLAAGEQVLTVATAQGESAPVAVVIDPAQAGLAAPAALNVGGRQYAAAVLADGVTLALPRGAVAGVESRPARVGETIELEGIGFGPVLPDVAAGVVAPAESALAAAVEVRIGGQRAEVVYAGLAPGKVGMYRLRVVVPEVPVGAAAVTFTLGSVESQQQVFLAVE